MAKRDYSNWSKDELLRELKKIEKRKKYGLNWDEKVENVVERCKKELPVLNEIKSRRVMSGPLEPYNFLIEGDNFHALSVLNYTHKDKIDVIYIDPPYNTGARDWKYNNDFVDAEDPYRHTKWISFMHHRLSIAKNVLAPDGIICVTIDDYELPRLWLLMEEIFGEKNHLGTIAIRSNPGGRKSKRKIAAQHEYALFFSKHSTTSVAKISVNPEEKSHSYKQKDNGEWYEERNLRKEGADSLAKPGAERYYPIYYDPKSNRLSTVHKFEVKILPIDVNGQKRIWRRAKDAIDRLYESGDLFAKETKFGMQVFFRFKGGLKGETPKSFWDNVKYSASEHGTQTLDRILGRRESFNFPKSPFATADCIKVASSKQNAIVLDFFAGSGTTAQAVLQLNKDDGGTRKFILCTNNENNIAIDVCLPRIEKVIKGYKSNGKFINGLGGNLRYYVTDFVDAEPTDKNKRKLVDKSTEMLCLREDCFDDLTKGQNYRMFTNGQGKHLGIIYDDDGIEPLKKEVKKLNRKFIVYVFSLDDSAREEEFEDVENLVELKPIPEVILNVYRRIFK